jgi:DNA-binding transcriptional LysR family regulator
LFVSVQRVELWMLRQSALFGILCSIRGTIMPDLNELQFFVQVSRTHSFTQAARRMKVPKSSVSRAISRLESRLGVRLVERTTRSVALTEAGALYLDHCQRVMDEAEQADLAVGALLEKPRGRLRIGAPVAFARSILGPVLGEFLTMYPELHVEVQLLNGDGVADENLDLVVRAGALQDSGMLVKPLMRIRLGVYASPSYLAAHGTPEMPADLTRQDCVTTNCGSSGEAAGHTVWKLRRGTELKEIRVAARVAVPDPTINHQLALAGAGVTLLAQAVVRDDLESGRLARLLPEWEPEPVELHALYPSRLNSSPKVRVFLEFIRARFGSDAWLGETQTGKQETQTVGAKQRTG